MCNPRSGAISIFFSIVFLSIVLLTMTTVDGIRIEAAKVDAQRAMDIATHSVLTNYDYDLSKQYGLIGFDTTDAKDTFQYFLEANLPNENNDFLSHVYNIEAPKEKMTLTATPMDHNEVRHQILEFMKFRAPLLTLEPFLSKLNTIIKSGDTVKKLSEKVKTVDQPMQAMASQIEQLRKDVLGWYISKDNSTVRLDEKYTNLWDYHSWDWTNKTGSGSINEDFKGYEKDKADVDYNYAFYSQYKTVLTSHYDGIYHNLLTKVVNQKITDIETVIQDNEALKKVKEDELEANQILLDEKKEEKSDLVSDIKKYNENIDKYQAIISNPDAFESSKTSASNSLKTEKEKLDKAEEKKKAVVKKIEEYEENKVNIEAEIKVLEAIIKTNSNYLKGFKEFVDEFTNKSFIGYMTLFSDLCIQVVQSRNQITPLEGLTVINNKNELSLEWIYKNNDGLIDSVVILPKDIYHVSEANRQVTLDSSFLNNNATLLKSMNTITNVHSPASTSTLEADKALGTLNSTNIDSAYYDISFLIYSIIMADMNVVVDDMTEAAIDTDNDALTLEPHLDTYFDKNSSAHDLCQDLLTTANALKATVDSMLTDLKTNEKLVQEVKVQMERELEDNQLILDNLLKVLNSAGVDVTADPGSAETAFAKNKDVIGDVIGKDDKAGTLRIVKQGFYDEFIDYEIDDIPSDLRSKSDLDHYSVADGIPVTARLDFNQYLIDSAYMKSLLIGRKSDIDSIVKYPFIENVIVDIKLDENNPEDFESAESLVRTETQEPSVKEGDNETPSKTTAKSMYEKIKGSDADTGSLNVAGVLPSSVTLAPSKTITDTASLYSRSEEYKNSGSPDATTDDINTSSVNGATNADLEEPDSSKGTNILDGFTGLVDKIANIILDVRDEIYVNEYIMGTFKTRTTQVRHALIQPNSTMKDQVKIKEAEDHDMELDMNLRYEPKINAMYKDGAVEITPKTALEYEVEYIIAGKLSDAENYSAIKLKLMLMRLPLNLIYLYTHSPERDLALTIAQVITFGIGAVLIPIVQFLILTAWAYAESSYDVLKLASGWKVPFIKTPSSFMLTFNVTKAQDAATTLIEGAASYATDKLKDGLADISSEIISKIDDLSADANDDIIKMVNDKLDDIADETESYALTLSDQFTRSFDQVIKESLRDIKRNGVSQFDITTIDGYEVVSGFLDTLNLNDEILDSIEDITDLEKLTEQKIESIRVDISAFLEDEIEGVIEKVNNLAQEKFEEASTEVVDKANSFIANQIDNGIDELSGQIDVAVSGYTNDLLTRTNELFNSSDNPMKNIVPSSDMKADGSNSFITAFEFKYEDYIRLFLIFINEDKKMARMMDLMQLNYKQENGGGQSLNFNNYGVAYSTGATFKVDYLFMPMVYNIITKQPMTNTTTTIKLKALMGY